jgi:hypothetical protein
MKNLVFVAFFGFMSVIASAQTLPTAGVSSTTQLDSLTKLAQRFINNNQADSLYTIMGDTFKSQISPDKLKEVMSQITGQLGKWTATESRGTQGGIARYKATFALAPLDFYISQDKQGKVETFLFKPLE